jgi:hypothetical protein
MPTFPKDALVRVYSLDEIAVEKLVALTDKARNEPRDLYDLWYLTSQALIDFGTLIPQVRAASREVQRWRGWGSSRRW